MSTPAAQQITLTALGLNYSPNQLSLPQGSLLEANNIIIRSDNTIESRRGLNIYNEPIGAGTDYPKQLIDYKDRIIEHYANKLAYDTGLKDSDGKAILAAFSGNYSETETGLRIKSIEANKNLYFTTSQGIQKISAVTAADFTTAAGFIQPAGAVGALDFVANLQISQGELNGFLPADSAVGYRVLFGYKDANQNLLLGAPSNEVIVNNFLSNIISMDMNAFTTILDDLNQSGSLITDGDYASSFYTPVNTDANTLQQNTLALAGKIDKNLYFANTTGTQPLTISKAVVKNNIATIHFSSGDPTTFISLDDNLNLVNFAVPFDVINGPQKIDQSVFNGNFASATNLSAPLIISQASLTSNVASITFSSGNPGNYVNVGDSFTNSNFTGSFSPFNGTFTIASVTANTITFALTNSNISSGTPTAGDINVQAYIAFTFINADIASASQITGNIYSYNYTEITITGDGNFSTPLSSLVISVPATSEQLRTIENTLQRYVDRMNLELPGVLSSTLISRYLANFNLTDSANVDLTITLPTDLTDAYFMQVYRTRIFTASGVQTLGGSGGAPVIPDDEMRLVFEVFPTAQDKTNGFITFLDDTPAALVDNNTNLYTNPQTGEGILNANTIPPFAKDINRFKDVTFYANTRTRHIIPTFQLLGTSNIASGDKITIAGLDGSDTYTFVTGVKEVTNITCTAASAITPGEYFILYAGGDTTKYYFWYSIDGSGTAPTVTDGLTQQIDILGTDSDDLVTSRTLNTINFCVYDFVATSGGSDIITVTTTVEGITTDATAGTTPFTVVVTTQGNGEDAATKQVLLSSLTSAAQRIEETANSLVRIINKQSDSIVNATYVSSNSTAPGQIALTRKTLDSDPFYILADSPGTGSSFTPDITPDKTDITTIAVGNPTIVTTLTPHGFYNLEQIMISGSDSTPSIDGIQTVTVLSPTTFSVPVHVTVAGTQGAFSTIPDLAVSTNEVKPNRVYYSKVDQPEAVPLLNFFDITAEDQEILRIFPLRNSLFAFKQDGTYRVSGASAPWQTDLFDTSCIVIAPDSVDVSNNIIYAWTLKGITNITETGTREISRPIDTVVLKLGSNNYPNFGTATWGVGYNSDNSYTVFTNSDPSDTEATVGFRYCYLTNTWTNVMRTQTCGIVLKAEDKLYMGSGLSNVINQERKSFTRLDYSDTDFDINLDTNALFNNGTLMQLTSVDNINVGDVITQDQTITIYQFNKLLTQLDLDPTISQNDFFATLQANKGDSIRAKLVALATKLDSDSGLLIHNYSAKIASITGTIVSNSVANPTIITASSVTNLIEGRVINITGTANGSIPPILSNDVYQVSNTGVFGTATTFTIPVDVTTAGTTGLTFSTASNLNTFLDIQACYNGIINALNDAGSGTTFKNYNLSTTNTQFEAVITSVNIPLNRITINLPLQWVQGPMKIWNSIDCEFTYAPLTMGDTLNWKQMYECTFMFNNKAMAGFTASFSSDLHPEFFPVLFTGQGVGIFGSYSPPGFGFGNFGGLATSAPYRTTIPRNAIRCRFLNVKVNHSVARELWSLYGITLTGNISISGRAYR